jgi:hypothetical protein
MKKLILSLIMIMLFVGSLTMIMAADDAFAILGQLEKNYVGLEKPGLDTLIAKAKCSTVPDATVTVYWAKGKGIKTKVEGGGPMAMQAEMMVGALIQSTGFGMVKSTDQYKLIKDNFTAAVEAVTLKDGTKAIQLTFILKEGAKVDFTKLVFVIDTKDNLMKQFKTSTKDAETVAELEYNKDGLLTKMTSNTMGVASTMTNTYITADKFMVPATTSMLTEGENIPANMKLMTITYSDVKVNAKIPEEIFAAPKTGDLPKPTETAAELMKQAQAAMQKGDMKTAKLKMNQIVTYYPNDPMAKMAEMMLKNLPK